jgi:hypothetical protein
LSLVAAAEDPIGAKTTARREEWEAEPRLEPVRTAADREAAEAEAEVRRRQAVQAALEVPEVAAVTAAAAVARGVPREGSVVAARVPKALATARILLVAAARAAAVATTAEVAVGRPDMLV